MISPEMITYTAILGNLIHVTKYQPCPKMAQVTKLYKKKKETAGAL